MSSFLERFANKYFDKSYQSKFKDSNNNQKLSKRNITKPNLSYKQQILQNNNKDFIDKNDTFVTRNNYNSSLPKKSIKTNLLVNNKKQNKIILNYYKSFEQNEISSPYIKNNKNAQTIDTFNKKSKILSKFGKYSSNNKNSSYLLNTSIISQMSHYEQSNSTKSLINKKNEFSYNNCHNSTKNCTIKNLDDKFKSLENDIIDTQYSNYIDNDELITSSTNKENINKIKSNKNQIKLTNILVYNNITNENNVNKSMDNSDYTFSKYFNRKLSKYDDNEDYLLNCSFENNKMDFNLVYNDDYIYTLTNDDTLELEIKYIIEKILELQNSYHLEVYKLYSKNKANKKIYDLIYENYRNIKKKIDLLHNIIEKKNEVKNKHVFFDSYKLYIDKEISITNINEILFWKNKFFKNTESNNTKNNKIKLRNLFKNIVFDKYYKIEDKLLDIENKIVCGMMRKYKFIPNNKVIKKNEKVQKSSLGLSYKKSQINEKGLPSFRNGCNGYKNKDFLLHNIKSSLIGEDVNKMVNGGYKKHNKLMSFNCKDNNKIVSSINKYKFK